MKRTKLAASCLLALLLMVFMVQTASACVPVGKNPQHAVSIKVGETVIVYGGDVAEHEVGCLFQGDPDAFEISSIIPPGPGAEVNASVDQTMHTLTITGMAPGSTSVQVFARCMDGLDQNTAWVQITVSAVPLPKPLSGGGISAVPPIPAQTREKAALGNCKEWAHVRSGPGAHFGEVGKAYLGETLELLQWSADGNWCKVFYNGGNNVGWIYGAFIIPEK